MQPPFDTKFNSTLHRGFDNPQGPEVELVITRGRAHNRVRLVSSPVFMIGTAPDCDLVLGDDRFPEVHAYLLLGQGPILLRWLGIDPEITVNGAQVDHVSLRDMDRLRTGPYEFLVRIGTKGNKRTRPHDAVPAPHLDCRQLNATAKGSFDVFNSHAKEAGILAEQLEQIEAALPGDGLHAVVEGDRPALRVFRGPTSSPDLPSSQQEAETEESLPPWPRWPINHHVFVS